MSTTKYIVNNVSGQTINGQQFVPKYKVYTALLTQSGGSVPSAISSGSVTKGVTYMILGDNGDYSNVGAPNNNDLTWFVAINNEVPITYGESELEYNTGAPIVTVLENTIGNIWFSYADVGNYVVNSNELFTINKTIFPNVIIDGGPSYLFSILGPNNYIEIFSSVGDSYLTNTPIEIRVYS
jgi:hypothetical protein